MDSEKEAGVRRPGEEKLTLVILINLVSIESVICALSVYYDLLCLDTALQRITQRRRGFAQQPIDSVYRAR